MPRTLKLDRELLRNFKKLGGWPNFLELWGQIDTEEEAQSMLHVGIALPAQSCDSDGRFVEICERADFFLTMCRHPNHQVSTTAQQLVVKNFLHPVEVEDTRMALHEKLLTFLAEPLASLQSAPYPRFVEEYLVKKVLAATLSPSGRPTKLTVTSPKLLLPLMAWGHVRTLGSCYYRLRDHEREELMEYFREYLHKEGCSPYIAFGSSPLDKHVTKRQLYYDIARALVELAGLEDYHAAAQNRKPEALLKILM